jgi:transcriptional pleiotropic regulator of transition state genes
MKSTGIIRKVDELGRIVIPIELRNSLKIVEKDPIEIFTDGSSIILKKHEESCIFCGSTEDIIEYKEKLICTKCSKKISKLNTSSQK